MISNPTLVARSRLRLFEWTLWHLPRCLVQFPAIIIIFGVPLVFTPLTCFLLFLWIYECNTFLLNHCVQQVYDTRLCTRLCKLLTSPCFFSTNTTCCKICFLLRFHRCQILLHHLGRKVGASQGLSTSSQAFLTTIANHRREQRLLWFL